jgi:hypothetical protein
MERGVDIDVVNGVVSYSTGAVVDGNRYNRLKSTVELYEKYKGVKYGNFLQIEDVSYEVE